MANKKFFTDESLATFVDEIKSYTDDAVSTKANTSHTHSISNVTNLQSSLDAKQATITGAATTITGSNLTASRALVSDSSGKVAVSAVTSTELGYLDGVTSAIQTQLDGKAASGHTHNYAGSSSAGGAATSANKVNKTLTVQLNGGSTEGTNKFTFDGSAAKSMNITASSVGAAASSHTHDDRYYTETEIDTKLSGKANTSHGNHVPATQTASNNTFLRNDNTWATVTPANIGAAASSHTHTVANITDLTATATELNYMDGVTSNVQTQLDGKANSSHNHSASNITSGTLSVARGGTGNTEGYVRAGQLSGSSMGSMATAEGRNTTSSGIYSHAEGNSTKATGISAHAEGQSAEASGDISHAEGDSTKASGDYSHAEGHGTIASGEGTHAEGRYNKDDATSSYAHIVGNGTSNSARSNAHTLDWDGNAWFAGDVYVGGTSQSDASVLATKAYVEELIGGIENGTY